MAAANHMGPDDDVRLRQIEAGDGLARRSDGYQQHISYLVLRPSPIRVRQPLATKSASSR